MLLNLVLNARDAIAGHGHITVRTRNITIDDRHQSHESWIVAGDYVVLEIADDGLGMDEEAKAHMFEPFFSTKPDGMGLGLHISRSIVEAHGGHMWATPNEGRGTVFHFSLQSVYA